MTKTKPSRLDQRLVELGLAETGSRAQALIMAREVLVDGEVKDKPGTRVAQSASIDIKEKLKYVSRGGVKLEGALKVFNIDPTPKTCLDIGASTGGFTDCLLQSGAKKVYAIDVGKGLLAWKLRQDKRVVVMEKINARYLTPDHIPEPIQLAVIDVSFISLALIIPSVLSVLDSPAEIIPLVKPQFEAGKDQVGKGGVVRDEQVIKATVDKISDFAGSIGLKEKGRAPSPIKGPKGNQEYFLYLLSSGKAGAGKT